MFTLFADAHLGLDVGNDHVAKPLTLTRDPLTLGQTDKSFMWPRRFKEAFVERVDGYFKSQRIAAVVADLPTVHSSSHGWPP